MSARQDRRIRRETIKYLRDAGATPEEIRKHWAAVLKPRPWWFPSALWRWLCWLVLKEPPGNSERLMIVDGKLRRIPR